jgi:hypothetical protein
MSLARYNIISPVAFQRVADTVVLNAGHSTCEVDHLKHKDVT